MRRITTLVLMPMLIVCIIGCGGGNNASSNDTGPPIEMNSKGPGSMKAPDQGGGAGVPGKMTKEKP